MRLKNIGIYTCVVAALLMGYIVSSSGASSKYAANVNGTKIKTATLDAAVGNFIESQKMTGVEIKEEDKEALRKGILEELISAELLYQESKKAEIGDLNEEAKEQFENIKKGFASEKEFKDLLKERKISEKDLMEDIKKGLSIKSFLEKGVYSDIVVSETDKRNEYESKKDKLAVPEQVGASHVLIRVEPDAGEEDKENAKAQIDGIRQRALAGEDFAELAKENSQDGSAPNGGDLGYFGRGAMVKPFEDAAFSLEVGQISEVVETQFGYHIIKVTDKQSARTLTYEEVESDIGMFLLNQRRGEVLNKLIDKLRSNAKIEVY